jgi:hypothetical protein
VYNVLFDACCIYICICFHHYCQLCLHLLVVDVVEFLALTLCLIVYQLFIYGDSSIPIEDAAFWQRGYQLRRRSTHDVQKANAEEILSKGQSVGPSMDVSGSQNSSPRSLMENVTPRQTAASPDGIGISKYKCLIL